MTNVRAIPDFRHWLAKRAYGGAFLITRLHARLDDLEGAILGNQPALAVDVARDILIDCAYVRAFDKIGLLPRSGIDWWLSADPFEYFDDRSSDLLRRIHLTDSASDLLSIKDELFALAAETEAGLALPLALPVVRDRDGYFPSLRLAREWFALVESVNLPPVVQEEWVSK